MYLTKMRAIRNSSTVAVLFGMVLIFFIWGGFHYPVHSERQQGSDDNAVTKTMSTFQIFSIDAGQIVKPAQKKERLAIQDQRLLFKKKNEYQLRGVEQLRDMGTSRGVQRGRQVTLESTGYTCGPESTGKYPSAPDYCKTASGYRLRSGDKVVAMGKKYSFGTTVSIPGYGLATVRDRGGAVSDNHIDLYFDRVEDALKWGRRMVTVTVF